MSKETITWIYVCDPPQDKDDPEEGFLYVTCANPEFLIKEEWGWQITKNEVWWFEVDRETLRVSLEPYDVSLSDKCCTDYLAEAALLDLSNIPIPTFDDEKPIIVVQSIAQSINYYIEE